jgi:hypothetical protein
MKFALPPRHGPPECLTTECGIGVPFDGWCCLASTPWGTLPTVEIRVHASGGEGDHE